MRDDSLKTNEHKDVIERYCPRRGENVIMLRTYDEGCRTECTCYSTCDHEKGRYCGCHSGNNQI